MPSTGYTGRLFEEEVLAICLFRWNEAQPYISFEKSLRLVQMCQPWDPSDPSTRAGNDLHCQVALALGLEDWGELQFFSALGSPLDRFHGIDGFFQWRGTVVSIDLTIDPQKVKYKADIVVHESDQNDSWATIGRQIADLFRQKTARGVFAVA